MTIETIPAIGENEYATTETPLAAFLLLEGYTLRMITYKDKPNRISPQATFIFGKGEFFDDRIRLYNIGQADVNLAAYEHTKSSLINRIKRGLP